MSYTRFNSSALTKIYQRDDYSQCLNVRNPRLLDLSEGMRVEMQPSGKGLKC